MKKLLLSVVACATISFASYAQLAPENFNSGTLPSGWVLISDGHTVSNSFANGNAAIVTGLTANAWMPVQLTTGDYSMITTSLFTPSATADRWLITPSFTVTSANMVFKWEDYDLNSGEGVEIHVSPTAGTTKASFTTKLYDQPTSTGALGIHSISLGAYNGQTIRLAFVENNTNDWGFVVDNVSTQILSPLDAAVDAVGFPSIVATSSSAQVKATISNQGATNITSVQLSYKVDAGTAVTQTFSGLNINPFATSQVTFTTPITGTSAGSHTLTVTALQVNGSADPVASNNTKTANFTTAVNSAVRKPFFEIFTSSTCPPCNPGNANYHSIVNPKDPNDYVSIKYQQDFPGDGDPYATTESVNRRNYYAINSIPRMEIDGGWDENANSFTNQLYMDATAAPAFYQLEGTYSVTGKAVSAQVKYTPYVASSGTKLYVAIIEGKTTKNVESNGETEFFSVMKKMLPDENGTAISTPVSTANTMNFNYTFNGNYRLPADGQSSNRINNSTENSVEEFTDLKVIAWIQSSDKQVLQAANLQSSTSVKDHFTSTIDKISVYPNPAVDLITVDIALKSSEEIITTLVDLTGKVVYSTTAKYNKGENKINVPLSGIASGNYHLMILDTKGNSSVHQVTVSK